MQPYKKSSSATNLGKAKPIIRGLHGEGDGGRQNITCRKPENARKLKTEKVLMEISPSTPERALKCPSVAEITPTKTPIKRISSISTDSCDIYATPRPFSEEPKKQLCNQDRNTCKNAKILLKCAWMWSRADTKSKQELIQKQKNQIFQMEMEKDVLNKLRKSESEKRQETQQECQRLKKNFDLLKLDNNQLNEEVENLKNTLAMYRNELKVAQAENNFLSEQSLKMQEAIAKNKSERVALDEKVKLREEEIKSQKIIIANLEATVAETERNLYQTKINYGIKDKKYVHLKCQFKQQLEANNSMSRQLELLQQEHQNVSFKAEDLQTQLSDYIESCATLKIAQQTLHREVLDISAQLREEKKRQWLENAKRFFLLSLGTLERIARLAVPAYMDRPVNF